MSASFRDLAADRRFEDGCVPTGWSNDLHLPDPKYAKGFEGDAFISKADFGHFPAIRERRPFWIPYRCLYSRNVSNLFMAGRDISVKHDALGAVRVMRTGGCMGELVGMAASICKRHGCAPRDVYARHLNELQDIMRIGTGKNPGSNPDYENGAEPKRRSGLRRGPSERGPAWMAASGKNMAPHAGVTVGTLDGAACARLTDGHFDTSDNGGRWLGDGPLPHVIEFTWDHPISLGAARIVSGYFNGDIEAPINDFVLQYDDGSDWKDIQGSRVSANQDPYYAVRFSPVTTTRARLCITGTRGGVSRVWEVELIAPTAKEPATAVPR